VPIPPRAGGAIIGTRSSCIDPGSAGTRSNSARTSTGAPAPFGWQLHRWRPRLRRLTGWRRLQPTTATRPSDRVPPYGNGAPCARDGGRPRDGSPSWRGHHLWIEKEDGEVITCGFDDGLKSAGHKTFDGKAMAFHVTKPRQDRRTMSAGFIGNASHSAEDAAKQLNVVFKCLATVAGATLQDTKVPLLLVPLRSRTRSSSTSSVDTFLSQTSKKVFFYDLWWKCH
jgi:hypothetical protein